MSFHISVPSSRPVFEPRIGLSSSAQSRFWPDGSQTDHGFARTSCRRRDPRRGYVCQAFEPAGLESGKRFASRFQNDGLRPSSRLLLLRPAYERS